MALPLDWCRVPFDDMVGQVEPGRRLRRLSENRSFAAHRSRDRREYPLHRPTWQSYPRRMGQEEGMGTDCILTSLDKEGKASRKV